MESKYNKLENEQRPVKLSIHDAAYPERIKLIMGNKAPEFLYLMGNEELLSLPSIGFCGSRKSSDIGLETARDCSEQAAHENIVVVSGNAAGVDSEAHYNSLKAGGKTIFVLPEGINHFRIRKAMREVWNWDNVLVLSQFEPDSIWQTYRAMTRNQLVIALSRVVIVIEAEEKGGTLNAGTEVLKSGLPLFVAEYQDMSDGAKGNRILLDMGARKLAKSRSTNRANLKHILECVYEDEIIKKATQQETFSFEP